MFTETAQFYDEIYAARGKDYRREADAVVAQARRVAPHAATLLDVACGTGAHLEQFQRHHLACRGLDKDFKMVALARARRPDIEIEPGDMLDFSLPERFDVVTCLFSAIAYTRTADHLKQAIATIAKHLTETGVLLIEPFYSPQNWAPGHLDAVFVDKPDLKIARMSVGRQVGKIAILDFHYLVATKKSGVERAFERHELGLFTEADYRAAFAEAGLGFHVLDEPAFRRGLYLGTRP